MGSLANFLTIFRLILLAPLIWLFYVEADGVLWAALGLYVVGSLTDFLDGWVARKYNQITPFGTFLDPISDKIFVSVILLMLVAMGHIAGAHLVAVILIFCREFLISGLREYLGPKNVSMPVTKLAKWKTASQMFALGFLIIGPLSHSALLAGLGLLWVSAALTVITGWGYLKAGLAHMR